MRARELVGAGLDLLGGSAERDRVAHEEARNARVRIRVADLVGLSARETGHAKRVAQAEALIDLGIDPQLGSRPQPDAKIGGGVPGLARLSGDEAVGPDIRRVKIRIVLDDVRRLRVHGPIVDARSRERGALSDDRFAELIVEPEADALQREIGGEGLRACGEGHAVRAEIDEEIFEVGRPVVADAGLHARTRHPA